MGEHIVAGTGWCSDGGFLINWLWSMLMLVVGCLFGYLWRHI